MRQITDHIIMIRPNHFGYNADTASNNTFQHQDRSLSQQQISDRALEEFDALVSLLESNGIVVTVIADTDSPVKPDAVFPNNWFSTHDDGTVITYAMMSPTRRAERREDVIDMIGKHYTVAKRYAFDVFEEQEQFLEGTGSLVLDRVHRIAYACLSPRTDVSLLDKFCVLRNYRPCAFHAMYDGKAVYHTNVVMALGISFAVICLDSIPDEKERAIVLASLQESEKEIIEITPAQMGAFAGNMIQLQSRNGEAICVMSEQAYKALTGEQISRIEKHSRIIYSPLPTIEFFGGGSARCMIAENFLHQK